MNGYWRRWRRRRVREFEAEGMTTRTAEAVATEEAETRAMAETICGRAAALSGEVSHWWDGIGWRRRLTFNFSDVPPERHAACRAWAAQPDRLQ